MPTVKEVPSVFHVHPHEGVWPCPHQQKVVEKLAAQQAERDKNGGKK